MQDKDDSKLVQEFYDQTYYAGPRGKPMPLAWHTRYVARRIGNLHGKRVLDVACGLGEWLKLLGGQGAALNGIDISERAVRVCRKYVPAAEIRHGSAEELPWPDASFDFVSCLGSLEHFPDKPRALAEMVRVGAADASFLILVPNAGFLTRRLGLYTGTQQVQVREDVYSLDEWAVLFRDAGLVVQKRWRDLHTLDYRWIASGPVRQWAVRSAQAAMLAMWPLRWQYQIYHLCRKA